MLRGPPLYVLYVLFKCPKMKAIFFSGHVGILWGYYLVDFIFGRLVSSHRRATDLAYIIPYSMASPLLCSCVKKLLRGVRFGFGSTRLTVALRKKTALLFVNQASALAGKGHFSTQPPKCYANF